MPANQKFLVVRFSDARQYLTPEQGEALTWILNSIKEGRTKDHKSDDILFTLSGRDRYAQPALEAYIEAVQLDPLSVRNDGSMVAMRTAQFVRDKGLQAGPQRFPTE